jgi:hypothetical protein
MREDRGDIIYHHFKKLYPDSRSKVPTTFAKYTPIVVEKKKAEKWILACAVRLNQATYKYKVRANTLPNSRGFCEPIQMGCGECIINLK